MSLDKKSAPQSTHNSNDRFPPFRFESGSRIAEFLENLRVWLQLPVVVQAPDLAQSLWRTATDQRIAREASIGLHILVLAILIAPALPSFTATPQQQQVADGMIPFFLNEYQKAIGAKPKGGGSGGESNSVPTTKGRYGRFDWLQKAPPALIRNPLPRLPAEASLLGPQEIAFPFQSQIIFGLPEASAVTNSNGPGHGGGQGNNCCGGQGPGNGRGAGPGSEWGYGGEGKPMRAGRNGVGEPLCEYCPTPDYSEEARKNKWQGTVLLRVVITPEGRAGNISIARGVGMGLEERAINAVRQWKFKPARRADGKAVPVEVLIEVTFRLL